MVIAPGGCSTAMVTGDVSGAATRTRLGGATVELVGTNRTAITDVKGRFVFTSVPAGQTKLVVSHPGMESSGSSSTSVPRKKRCALT